MHRGRWSRDGCEGTCSAIEERDVGRAAVAPKHRGHGLGLQVCQAVLDFIHGLGHGYAYLLTDDFRLPAIKTYLRLGFEPEIVDPSHPARWAALRQALTPDTSS